MRRFLGSMQKRSQYFRIYGIFGVILLGIGGWFFASRTAMNTPISIAEAQEMPPNGLGFLWTDSGGWISMNCENDWDSDGAITLPDEARCTGPGGAYGVSINVSPVFVGTLEGWAWSPNLGLVCFGTTCGGCTGAVCRGRAEGTPVEATFNWLDRREVEGSDGVRRFVSFIRGFARLVRDIDEGGDNLGGWISLNGTAPGSVPIEVAVWRDVVTGNFNISGAGWQQNSNGAGVGWVYFGNAPPGNAPDGVADAQSAQEAPDIPARETGCDPEIDGVCCNNRRDDDFDLSYTTTEERDQPEDLNPNGTGADCTDYDCADAPNCPDQENLDAAGNQAPEQCFDQLDNDLDGWVRGGSPRAGAGTDCTDADCANAVWGLRRCTDEELNENVYNGCYDGIDNDGNGFIDCADPDCNSEAGYVLCRTRFSVCVCTTHSQAGELSARYGLTARDCREDEDDDRDGIHDTCDNCPNDPNPNQEDTDADGLQRSSTTGGDACDPIAWLQTREGLVYARGVAIPPPPPAATGGERGYTSTFCILVSNAQLTRFDFRTNQCNIPLDRQVDEFRLRQYSDSVVLLSDGLRARIGVDKLRSSATNTSVETLTDQTLQKLVSGTSRRFYVRGDLRVNETLEFPADRGALTVLVEGNLFFDAKAAVRYAGGAFPQGVANLSKLPSVAWVVLDPNPEDSVTDGNITIHAEVQELAGAFIASGRISTGTRGSAGPDVQLRVSGLMAARQFGLERQFADLAQGAEVVTYDGRAILNPPPGLEDLVKTLPTLRAVAPP